MLVNWAFRSSELEIGDWKQETVNVCMARLYKDIQSIRLILNPLIDCLANFCSKWGLDLLRARRNHGTEPFPLQDLRIL